MHDTAGDEDVWVDDAGGVDEDFAVDDGDVDVWAGHGGEGSALQEGGVGDGAVDDVVLEEGGGLGGGEVGEDGADILEGGVGGREDGDVLCHVEGHGEVGGLEGTGKGGQASGFGGGRDILGDGEGSVDNVHHPVGDGDVLRIQSQLLRPPLQSYSFDSQPW